MTGCPPVRVCGNRLLERQNNNVGGVTAGQGPHTSNNVGVVSVGQLGHNCSFSQCLEKIMQPVCTL